MSKGSSPTDQELVFTFYMLNLLFLLMAASGVPVNEKICHSSSTPRHCYHTTNKSPDVGRPGIILIIVHRTCFTSTSAPSHGPSPPAQNILLPTAIVAKHGLCLQVMIRTMYWLHIRQYLSHRLLLRTHYSIITGRTAGKINFTIGRYYRIDHLSPVTEM